MQASVIVPVRGRPDLLHNCLVSLSHQSCLPEAYEVVICDDGSAEDLRPVIEGIRSKRIRLISQDQRGPAAARNLGIRSTSSPVLVFVDSDVILDGDFLRVLLRELDAHPEWEGAEACLIPIGELEGPLWEAPFAPNGGRYQTAAIAYRRQVLEAAGGFDEDFRLAACEDVELAMRVLERGPIGFVPEAKAFHPRRRVTFSSRWRQRLHWQYRIILAERYSIFGFPDCRCTGFPRFKIAAVALFVPVLRLFGLKSVRHRPTEVLTTLALAVVELFGVFSVIPGILFMRVKPRRSYLTCRR